MAPPMIAWVIEESSESVSIPDRVRLMHELGFSVQRPRRRLARAKAGPRPLAALYLSKTKNTTKTKARALIFRRKQFPAGLYSVHATWSWWDTRRRSRHGGNARAYDSGCIDLWDTDFITGRKRLHA